MKIKYTASLAIVITYCISAMAQFPHEIRENKAIIVESDTGDILTAAPIFDGLVIRFENDSVVFSTEGWSSAVELDDVSGFLHVNECRSDFAINLTSNDDEFSLSGLEVNLSSEDETENSGTSQTADDWGNTLFKDLPTGLYSLSVINDEETLLEFQRVIHGYNDTVQISLAEDIILSVPLEPASVVFSVFTLDGQFLMRTSEFDDLKGLDRGIYVINGEKVLIKK